MCVMSGSGAVISAPSTKPYPHMPFKCTDCAPLFHEGISNAQCWGLYSQSWTGVLSHNDGQSFGKGVLSKI
ncbi:hypothetical protein ZIOFF_033468 [Zingiber officinale]|uniref:Uncharacterized protein n=1 Tax=Zingiber officinale TaxID=94328 RepID=A0A8J5GJE3_ZINOF|nr:hypothetical protein ZIOFF_033468 [Zingiber officinale]